MRLNGSYPAEHHTSWWAPSVGFRKPAPDHLHRQLFRLLCPDLSQATVILCPCQLFSFFGRQPYVHSDQRWPSWLSVCHQKGRLFDFRIHWSLCGIRQLAVVRLVTTSNLTTPYVVLYQGHSFRLPLCCSGPWWLCGMLPPLHSYMSHVIKSSPCVQRASGLSSQEGNHSQCDHKLQESGESTNWTFRCNHLEHHPVGPGLEVSLSLIGKVISLELWTYDNTTPRTVVLMLIEVYGRYYPVNLAPILNPALLKWDSWISNHGLVHNMLVYVYQVAESNFQLNGQLQQNCTV